MTGTVRARACCVLSCVRTEFCFFAPTWYLISGRQLQRPEDLLLWDQVVSYHSLTSHHSSLSLIGS